MTEDLAKLDSAIKWIEAQVDFCSQLGVTNVPIHDTILTALYEKKYRIQEEETR